MRNKFKVVIAAGGSGGHLFPAQQLAEQLKEGAEVVFAGHQLSQSPFFSREGVAFEEVSAAPLKKGFISASWKGFWQAIRFLWRFDPDVVVGFGSFHSFPVLCAAAILRKKLVLFEANCALGKVNRLFSPFAKCMAGQFLGTLVPLLPWKELQAVAREEARDYFGLCRKTFTLLIFGGSQGAAFLNEVMPAVCAQLGDVQVIHLCGKGEVRYSVRSCVKSFEKEMARAYAAADVAVCRAGAGTIAELIQYHVPALCIPYPFAVEDHQKKNGEFFARIVGGGEMLVQSEATVEKIAAEVETLRKGREKYQGALRRYAWQSKERRSLEKVIRNIISSGSAESG